MVTNQPKSHRHPCCAVCGRHVDQETWVGHSLTCGRWSCRGRLLAEETHVAVEQRKRERREQVIQVLGPAASAIAKADGHHNVDQLLPVVVPAHDSRTVPVPEARCTELSDHIEDQLRVAVESEDHAWDTAVIPPEEQQCSTASASSDREMMLWGQACGACGGRCCLNGTARMAFITPGTIARYRDQSGRDPEQILGDYQNLFPKEHVEGSCVYHTKDGCALPRDMRSGTCNRFVCEGLAELQALTAKDDKAGYLIAAVDDGEIRQYRVVDAQERQYGSEPDRGLERM